MSVIINKNGRTIVVNGDVIRGQKINSMVINGGRITIDGKSLSELDVEDEKVINITIQGDVERLEVDYCDKLTVTGNAKRVKSTQGDIEIHGNVEGDCHANMGNIYRR